MTIYSDPTLLNRKFGWAVDALNEYLIDCYETGHTKTLFKIFETFRDPSRQADLLKKKVTKAGPFQSPHQFGLACDFVPYLTPEEAIALTERTGERHFPGWNWHSSHDYRFLATAAEKFNLAVPIAWDPCHVEHPAWKKFRLNFSKTFE